MIDKNKCNKNMRYNKYNGSGKVVKQSLSIQEKAEATIKALWSLKIKPLLSATRDNLFYGFVFGMAFTVLCLVAHAIFYFGGEPDNAKSVLQLVRIPSTWMFAFCVGYLFKITTTGNWCSIAISFVVKIAEKLKAVKNKKSNNNNEKGEVNE